MEQTFTMIKPDAVERGESGHILARMEAAGFAIRRLKMVHLSTDEARQFYAVHTGKEFFEKLVAYMSSGPICVVVLEKENAILDLRKLVGATDPAKAEAGTIRKDFGIDTQRNAVHASDGVETAREEIAFYGLTLKREA